MSSRRLVNSYRPFGGLYRLLHQSQTFLVILLQEMRFENLKAGNIQGA